MTYSSPLSNIEYALGNAHKGHEMTCIAVFIECDHPSEDQAAEEAFVDPIAALLRMGFLAGK
jgi:hypothetical protein